MMEELDGTRGNAPERASALFDLASGPLPDSVKALQRGTAKLPTDQDFYFYSNFQEFKRPVAELRIRVVSLLSQMGSLNEVRSRPSAFPADPDEAHDWLVGVQDDFLERVDASVDRFQLERKDYFKEKKPYINAFEALSKQNLARKASPLVVNEDVVKAGDVKVARSKSRNTTRSPVPFHVRSIPRPQDKFDQAVDNSSTPFKHPCPKGRNRQESQADCSQGLHQGTAPAPSLGNSENSSALSSLSALDKHTTTPGVKDSTGISHPLEEELMEMAYVEGLTDTVVVRKYESLDNTPFTLVRTLQSLKEMASKLRIAGEIAVSTCTEDFVVDTLELRSQIYPCLGDIFSDPTIKKVMHGADHDIVWLQRDFGIYVCNLFDTGQAARVLQLQGFGLAFLLEHFCGVYADKRYQLADWRIRPLPSEMLKYAREDTHYLLYVHDILKQQLLTARTELRGDEEDPTLQVYKRSRDICLQLYSKEVITETSYQQLHGLQEKKFRPDQLAVLAALYSWRDQISRKEDESTGYVLPNHLLLQLASEMPVNVRQLQNLVKGSHALVSRSVDTVLEVIRQAKEKAMEGHLVSLPDHGEHEQREDSLKKEECAGDKLEEGEISTVDHSVFCPETLTKIACHSPRIEGQKVEINVLQQDNLDDPSEPISTMVGISHQGGNCGPCSSGSDIISVSGQVTIDSTTEKAHGVRQLKLTSERLPEAVVVRRRTSSSFFSTRPPKASSIPVPSPMSIPEISKAQDSPTVFLAVPTSDSLGNGQVTPEELTTEHGRIPSLDDRQGLEHAKERRDLGKIPEIGMELRSVQIQTGSPICSLEQVAVSTADDMSFTVPAISLPQISLGHVGKDTETHVSTGFAKESTNPAPNENPIENMVIPAKKKPSGLGAFLGGRSRFQQTGADSEQVQAKMKNKVIESSLVLRFGPLVLLHPDSSEMDAQSPAAGGTKVSTGITAVKMDSCQIVEEDAGSLSDEGTLEGQAHRTTPLGDILMFNVEADEVCPNGEIERRMGDNGNPLEKHQKQRKWWPPAAVNPNMTQRSDVSSSLSRPHETAQSMEEPGNDSNSQLPLSLSEMHRNSRRRKRKRNHPKLSKANGSSEVAVRDLDSRGSDRNEKRGKEKSLSISYQLEDKRMVNSVVKTGVRGFNYTEARKALGVEDLYADKPEDRNAACSRGRGRGSKRGNSKPSTKLNKSVFDPLRRVMEEPRPEGIKPGQRRQVFPQTGNRTAVFKQ